MQLTKEEIFNYWYAIVQKQTKLSETELNQKIEEIVKSLKGLVLKDGALLYIAKQLGVELKMPESRFKATKPKAFTVFLEGAEIKKEGQGEYGPYVIIEASGGESCLFSKGQVKVVDGGLVIDRASWLKKADAWNTWTKETGKQPVDAPEYTKVEDGELEEVKPTKKTKSEPREEKKLAKEPDLPPIFSVRLLLNCDDKDPRFIVGESGVESIDFLGALSGVLIHKDDGSLEQVVNVPMALYRNTEQPAGEDEEEKEDAGDDDEPEEKPAKKPAKKAAKKAAKKPAKKTDDDDAGDDEDDKKPPADDDDEE